MSHFIRSISGIRGIPGATLDPATISRYAAAFSLFADDGPIVVGYDGRPSGRAIHSIVCGALTLCGRDVYDIGLAPTPSVQLIVEMQAAAGGISITASHNPSEWNGLKFLDRTGIFLDEEQNARLFDFADAEAASYASWDRIGSVIAMKDFRQLHIDKVLTLPGLDLAGIRLRGFKVVVDAVNASGSVIVPELLRTLGCETVELFCRGNGVFPHTPEPIPENLAQLGEAVLEHKADLGIAVDPDADRLVLIMENGKPFGEEYTVTTCVDNLLRISSGGEQTVVVNLSTTRAVDDVAARYGARVIRTPVGEINVAKKMVEVGALVGGEGSGGVIVPAVHAGRDSLVGIACVLNALAAFDGPISKYRASLPNYEIVKTKYPLGELRADEVIQQAIEAFAGERINTDDGVRIDFEDGWAHVRKSNTEPIMRIISEGRDEAHAGEIASRIIAKTFGRVMRVPV